MDSSLNINAGSFRFCAIQPIMLKIKDVFKNHLKRQLKRNKVG